MVSQIFFSSGHCKHIYLRVFPPSFTETMDSLEQGTKNSAQHVVGPWCVCSPLHWASKGFLQELEVAKVLPLSLKPGVDNVT